MPCGLSEEEEKRLLLLLEGDISDIDLSDGDDDCEEDIEEQDHPPQEVPENECGNISGIQVEVETTQADTNDDWDEDDDVPLSSLIRGLPKPIPNRKTALWKKCHLNKRNTYCNRTYSNPGEVKSPLNYFKMFFDDTIITNLLHFDRKLHMRS